MGEQSQPIRTGACFSCSNLTSCNLDGATRGSPGVLGIFERRAAYDIRMKSDISQYLWLGHAVTVMRGHGPAVSFPLES